VVVVEQDKQQTVLLVDLVVEEDILMVRDLEELETHHQHHHHKEIPAELEPLVLVGKMLVVVEEVVLELLEAVVVREEVAAVA
jgi:hypothetical protein